MSAKRVTKQLVYLGIYIGIFVVVIGGAVVLVDRPTIAPPPAPTPTQTYQPIVTESVDLVQHPGAIDVVARVRNANIRAGIAAYPVTFVVLNQQRQEITRQTATSYVLPGSLQYIVALNIPLQQPAAAVKLDVPSSPRFIEMPTGVDVPTFGVFLRHRSRRTVGNAEIEQQVGIVRNTSTFNFQRVEVVALAHDAAGRVVGIGKTFVGGLQVGEQREFTAQWPATAAQTTRVTTLPSVNIFLEENIIDTVGDPRTLE